MFWFLNRSILKEKKSKFFPFSVDRFSQGLDVQERKQEVKEFVPLE